MQSDFKNDKKTFLSKLDKSKKGEIDGIVLPLLRSINLLSDYYTTSSCSGRVYLWKYKSSEKKNEMEWLKVSHELINIDFFKLDEYSGLIWLRLEDFIIHICCKDLDSANLLLNLAKKIYKKSNILSASNKIIVEIRGSELIEMPLYLNGELLFCGNKDWLVKLINNKLEQIWEKINLFHKEILKIKIF